MGIHVPLTSESTCAVVSFPLLPVEADLNQKQQLQISGSNGEQTSVFDCFGESWNAKVHTRTVDEPQNPSKFVTFTQGH